MHLHTAGLLSITFILTLLYFPAVAEAETVLVKRGQKGWRYWDKGERPPQGWNKEDFDDTAWETGTAPLGYGVEGIASTINLGNDNKRKNPTAYFRLTFEIDPNSQHACVGELRCDDGAAVYLNGKEIYRYNMPKGELDEATFACRQLSRYVKTEYHPFYLDTSQLKDGENVLAISVHQGSPMSGDLVMDFALTGGVDASGPEAKPLSSDGTLEADDIISSYINSWAKHLLKQDRSPIPSRFRFELDQFLDREVGLVEPSNIPLSAEELYEKCAPGVLILSGVADTDSLPPMHGSGFVISADGLAITNRHVMRNLGGANVITATTLSGKVVRVKEILATDEADDIALVQLDGEGFHPLPIAKSASVGADLVTISHPVGSLPWNLDAAPVNAFFTLTKGQLARRTRADNGRPRIMATSEWALGSSGAPIFDRFGCVAGVVSAFRPFAYRVERLHEEGGVIKLGKGNPDRRGLFLPMGHQMTLGVGIPCDSLHSFLKPLPLLSAEKIEGAKAGLHWQLYAGAWSALPDFATLDPIGEGTCESPTADVHGGRQDDYALVFTGFVDIPRKGVWQFRATSDDGSRLFIDHELVVDNDGIHAPVERSGIRRLAAGLHAVRIEFFERGNGEVLKLEFSGPEQPWTEIPASAFRRAAIAGEKAAVTDSRLAEILAGETPENLGELSELQRHVHRLVERVLPATVLLSNAGQPWGSSGILVQRDGRNYVLSAAHSTRSAGRKMTIWMPDGSQIPGVTLGADRRNDVGLVLVETEAELPGVEIGGSANLKRGQWVLMLGHPSGRKPGRTAPVRLGRVLGVAKSGFVVTDCAMQGGDSGGPLLDMDGRLVGINSFCTPNLAVNVHGPIDPLVDQWAEFHDGKVIESKLPNKSKVSVSSMLLAQSLSQGDAMRKAWASVAARANASIVRVFVGDEQRAIGTAVARNLVVTKYSEIADEDENAERTCRQGENSWSYSIVGHDYPSDLAVLRIIGGQLEPIAWHDATPSTGSLLASPGGDSESICVGVLSAPPYQHTQPHIKLGVWFKNWFKGQPQLQGVHQAGAANEAGLRAGDVVTQFAQERIDNTQQLMRLISKQRVGDKVEVTVKRDDAEMTFEVTLGDYRRSERVGQEVVWGPLSDVRTGFEIILQHDTVLKPERCGGPLIDLEGQAVGLNISRAGRVETLALPAGEVQRLVTSLVAASIQAKPAGR